MQKRKVQELKIQASLLGVEFSDKDATKKKKEEVEATIEDPLRNFPNDVVYRDAKDCDAKIRLSQRLDRPIECQWDIYRKECCLGQYGIVARRCSVNDVLWGRYLKIKETENVLTLNQVRAMVEFDIIRRQLYPPDYNGKGEESPPEEYIAELKKTGKYIEILQKLDDTTAKMNTCSKG